MNNKKIAILATVITVVIVSVGVVLFFVLKDRDKNNEKNESSESDNKLEVEYIDAEKYFEENSNSVVSSSLQDTDELLCEADAAKLFQSLGFDQFAITTEYSAGGDFYEEREITADSLEKHPVYQTFYYTEKEELWTISIVKNQIMAYPVSYAMRAEENANVVVSLSRTITSYDNVSKQFFVTEPKENALRVIVVDKIDSETLEAITDETLSGKR